MRQEQNGDSTANLRTIRVIGATIFGFGIWIALALSLGGLACTAQFSCWNAVYWFELYTVFGFVYWTPIVMIAGGIGYCIIVKTGLAARPLGSVAVAVLAVIATFCIVLIVPHAHGPCSYL
jgi:hypothetical protein